MSNTELVILLGAVFVWGAFSGILFWRILVSDPLQRELQHSQRREDGWRQFALEHRGTPYRPETVAAAARLPRDDEWSKKVPPLEVVQ